MEKKYIIKWGFLGVVVLEIKTIVCEKNPEMQEQIKEICNYIPSYKILGAVRLGKKALSLAQKTPPQVVLSNINLPDINGIEIARILGEKYPTLKTILIDNNGNCGEEVVEAYTYDYIPMQSLSHRLPQTLSRIRREYQQYNLFSNGNKKKLRFKCGNREFFLNSQEIFYIKTQARQIKVICSDSSFLLPGSIKQFEPLFPSHFFRCHRSYLVNLEKIQIFDRSHSNSSIVLLNGERIPVSRNKRKNLDQKLNLIF